MRSCLDTPAKPLQPCPTQSVPSSGGLSPEGYSCYVRALASRFVLGGARTVCRSVLEGSRNNEWHALGALVLVGAFVQVGVNWTSLGRGIQVRLGAPRRFPASKWRHPPNGHRPDLTLQRQVQTDQAESHLRGGGTWTTAMTSAISNWTSCIRNMHIKRWRRLRDGAPAPWQADQTPINSAFGATTGRAAKKMGGLDMLEAFSMRKP